MNDPINPWLDPSEVRYLAEKLLRPIEGNPSSDSARDFGPSFEGYMPPISSKPVTAEKPAGKKTTAPEEIKFDPEISKRATEILSETQARHLAIISAEGKLLFAHGNGAKYIFAAKQLVNQKTHPTPTRIRLGSKITLQIIPSEFESRKIILVGVFLEKLSPESIQKIHSALS